MISTCKSSLILFAVLAVFAAVVVAKPAAEQEAAPNTLAVCINAESHPESVEYKIKCLSGLMDEFYSSLIARKFKKAYALARFMNKFELLHPDIKQSGEISSSEMNESTLFARAAAFANLDETSGAAATNDAGRDKRRTFFVGK